jgi:putative hydrolase of the HAD superfamily
MLGSFSIRYCSMIRSFLFDIGNVLLRFDFNLALKKLALDPDPAAEKVLDLLEPLKASYESGGMDRAQFQKEARAILRYTGSDADFVCAWEDIFTENAPMVDLVHQLHGRFPLYLLSNTSDLHVDYIFRRYAVFGMFSDAVYSYKVRAAKPHREIYEIAQRQLGIRPAETFFIDDLLPNIETARQLGFHAHHYHHDRHEALLREIAEAGVKL